LVAVILVDGHRNFKPGGVLQMRKRPSRGIDCEAPVSIEQDNPQTTVWENQKIWAFYQFLYTISSPRLISMISRHRLVPVPWLKEKGAEACSARRPSMVE
jgi:hypothetical protein